MKLLVSGCSVTHGAELHNGFMSTENIKQSFSAHLAEKLGLELINVALSGGSNEYIFHSAIQQIQQCSDISHVLIAWTSICRLCWKANGRYYFFLPIFFLASSNLHNQKRMLCDRLISPYNSSGNLITIFSKMSPAIDFS